MPRVRKPWGSSSSAVREPIQGPQAYYLWIDSAFQGQGGVVNVSSSPRTISGSRHASAAVALFGGTVWSPETRRPRAAAPSMGTRRPAPSPRAARRTGPNTRTAPTSRSRTTSGDPVEWAGVLHGLHRDGEQPARLRMGLRHHERDGRRHLPGGRLRLDPNGNASWGGNPTIPQLSDNRSNHRRLPDGEPALRRKHVGLRVHIWITSSSQPSSTAGSFELMSLARSRQPGALEHAGSPGARHDRRRPLPALHERRRRGLDVPLLREPGCGALSIEQLQHLGRHQRRRRQVRHPLELLRCLDRIRQ